MNILHYSEEEQAIGKELREGIKDALPIMLGVAAFGISYGVMGVTAGLTGMETLLMSVLVFAGAAQFISLTMLGSGISGLIIIFTTMLINLRHILMSTSLAPHMSKLSLKHQALLAFGLTDESYVLTINRVNTSGYSAVYHAVVSAALYGTWIFSTFIGIAAGAKIPNPLEWGLDFTMAATFLVLLMPRLTDRISLYVFGIAAVVSVAGALYLPGKWYIIVSCLLASLTGGILEGKNTDAK